MALSSVEKALRIAPDALGDRERDRLISLINERFDRRIALLVDGVAVWDVAVSHVMVVTGVTPTGRDRGR